LPSLSEFEKVAMKVANFAVYEPAARGKWQMARSRPGLARRPTNQPRGGA